MLFYGAIVKILLTIILQSIGFISTRLFTMFNLSVIYVLFLINIKVMIAQYRFQSDKGKTLVQYIYRRVIL